MDISKLMDNLLGLNINNLDWFILWAWNKVFSISTENNRMNFAWNFLLASFWKKVKFTGMEVLEMMDLLFSFNIENLNRSVSWSWCNKFAIRADCDHINPTCKINYSMLFKLLKVPLWASVNWCSCFLFWRSNILIDLS